MTEPVDSQLDEKIQLQYRVWKKNTPFLYDYISTYSLLWPSLCVSFFPDLETTVESQEVLLQRLLLGTFTLGQSIDSISMLQLPYYKNLNQNLDIDRLNFNPDKLEFELGKVSKKKMSVLQKINHLGDVNKLRYMPQNADIIASGNNMGNLVIYNRTKHSSYNTINTDINTPDLILGEQEIDENQDIYAIDWNRQIEGMIASGKMNGRIDIYDIKSQFKDKDNTTIKPIKSILNVAGVNDIEWVRQHDSIFCIVDEAGHLKLIDMRTDSPTIDKKISPNAINSVSINPMNQQYLSTGDSKGVVEVWDIRNLDQGTSLFNLSHHTDSITQVKWHPKFHNILASSSSDKFLKIFDVDKQPDPLIFNHGGHMLGVNDFDWSLHDDWMVASVADDNSLHVWKPSKEIVKSYS